MATLAQCCILSKAVPLERLHYVLCTVLFQQQLNHMNSNWLLPQCRCTLASTSSPDNDKHTPTGCNFTPCAGSS